MTDGACLFAESHGETVRCLAERRDGTLLSGSRNEIKHWRLFTDSNSGGGCCIGTFTDEKLIHGLVNAIVDWDDDLFISGCSSGSIVVWSFVAGGRGRPVGRPLESPPPLNRYSLASHVQGISALIKAVHISKEPILISGGEHGDVKGWDVKTRTLIMTFPTPYRQLLSLCELDDGSLAMAGNGVMIFNRDRLVWTKPSFGTGLDLVYGIACGVQPNTVAVATADISSPVLEIWNFSKDAISLKTRGHHRGASQIIRSNDNRTLITSSWDKTVKRWCPKSGECLSSVTTPSGASCLLELNNGSLVVGLSDGRIAHFGLSAPP